MRGMSCAAIALMLSGCNALVGGGELSVQTDAPPPDASGPVLTILGQPLVFAAPRLGQAATLDLMIQNEGTEAATGITIAVDSAEATASHECGTRLEPRETCTASVTLTATSLGEKHVMVTVGADGGVTGAAEITGTATATLAVTIEHLGGAGGGVTSMPAGLDCSTGTCMASFAASPVRLIAKDDGDGTLAKWSVSGCTTVAPCDVALTSATNAVTATFRAPWTYVAADTSDSQFDGVAIDPTDGSAVAVGQVAPLARVVRLDSATGQLVDSATESSASGPRAFRDVAIGATGAVAISGDTTGTGLDATLDLYSKALDRTGGDAIVGAGTEQGFGVARIATKMLWIGSYGGATFVNQYDGNGVPTTLAARAFAVPWYGKDVAFGPNGTMWAVAGTSAAWVGSFTATAGGSEATMGASQTRTDRRYNRIEIDAAGNLYLAGSTAGGLAVWKLTSTFTQTWMLQLNGTASDAANGLALAPSGDVLVAGNQGTSCVIARIDATTGTERAGLRRTIANTTCAAIAAGTDGFVVAGSQNGGAIARLAFARKYFY